MCDPGLFVCVLTYSKVWLATDLASNEAGDCRETRHVGWICLRSTLVSSFLERGPLSAVLFLVKKSFSLFNNHQPYVAQTYRDEKSCLGLWGSAGHGKLERGEEENEIKDSLCFCQIFSLPLFAVWELARLLIWWLCADLSIPPVLCSNVDEDQWRQREERRDAAVSSDAHTHTNLQCSRLHSSLSTITPDCTGDSLQYTFYEPFTRFSALVLSLSC